MALLGTLLATALTWPPSASAVTAPLVGSGSGRCLDVTGNTDAPGTALELWDCNGQANQAFEFTSAAELRTMGGTRCVDTTSTQPAPGTPVVIKACSGQPGQTWRQNSDGSITGLPSGLCLDANGAGTANGTAVIMWTCNGQSNQKWSLASTPPTTPPPSGSRSCDIYAAGGTPCVAAHSTVRALYGAYSGSLYQVRRSSDSTTRDIGVVSAGGRADAGAQDAFCANTTCVITTVYDQSGHGNDLKYQGPGGAGGSDTPAKATSESLTVGGGKAYSLYINPGNSYWRDGHLTGVPTGSAPEGAYMVTSGTHVNSGCCFDYGNSETDRRADGAGAMDAIYFGTSCWFGGCSGSGPWVQADLEYGLYSGGSQSWNGNQRAFTSQYVTAMLKNNGTSRFAIKGANAQTGSLTTLWNGALPPGYSPMKKQGAIILGSGGDCCNGNTNQSQGTFYEGAIVAGYPSDATDDAVQADITAAGYR
ncbi:arabinofuranosidase catalytic domain-containing protein [Streptomyces sp. NPDC021224]|uniref:arabinofuranosidase catalytic domain-containing protein n=1 Tax=unclassified Streptomyces TaxID=2593676 RepID=UPI0037B82B35